MISLKNKILQKLDKLPESDLREVLDFIEFRNGKKVAQDIPLLSVAGILSGNMPSAEEIETELYGRG